MVVVVVGAMAANGVVMSIISSVHCDTVRF